MILTVGRIRYVGISLFWLAVQLSGAQTRDPSLATIRASLERHEYQAALAQAGTLLQQQPQDARLWVAQGLALRGLQRTSESLDSFEHSLLLRPGNLMALEGAAEAAYTLQDPKAQTFIDGILTADPYSPVANAMAGSLAYERGDCARAITSFDAAGKVLEDNSIASLQLSHCLVLSGEAAKAVTVLQPLQQRENTRLVAFDLAYALFYAASYEQSAGVLEQLRKQGDDSPEVWDLLGADYNKLDRVPAALDAYRNACDKAPDVPGYYIDLARFAMEHSSTDAALKVLSTAITNIPHSAALLTVRGSIYSFAGDTTRAEADFESAETADPRSGYGGVGKSLLLSQEGKSSDGQQLLRIELKKKPNDNEIKYFLAEALSKDPTPSNNEEAEHLLTDVLKERPDDPGVLLALAKTHLVKQENRAALILLQHAREVDPDSAPILNHLLQTYRALGMRQESAAIAGQLRGIVDRDREVELRRNRFQIMASSGQQRENKNQ
jgi:cytochrome c-type biogenesis protein CcmH/NrfG